MAYFYIFEKDAPVGNYTPNKYYIYGRVNDTGTNRRIGTFTTHWGDDSLAPASYPDAGFGIDENVTGTIYSYCKAYYPSGAGNVYVPPPPASATGWA